MPRISPVTEPDARQQPLLEGVRRQLGRVPNIFATMVHSPALLEGYLGFSKALGGGSLSTGDREAIALLLAGRNGCDYCAAAHTAIGKAAKLDGAELAENLSGRSGEAKRQALLDFVAALVRDTGAVSDDSLAAVRAAGYDDGQILEAVGHAALNIFTNSFNRLAGTSVDFPGVTLPVGAAAA